MVRTVLVALLVAAAPSVAVAQDGDRELTIRFEPTGRAQIAVWLESADGERFHTVMLTQATALRGIGNRPGATQMNSGFRWPYGRREGVLPVWAHRRADATGRSFPRVIFNGRESEGLASVSLGEPSNTRDDYFCLSFDSSRSRRDALDAVSCASVFNSNKGRYLTEEDESAGYAEPWEEPDGDAYMRPMSVGSPYPPRRDLADCGSSCEDHEDVARFAADARAVMPRIDAVTAATPRGDRVHELQVTVPPDWPDGDYVAFVEINVEGDYNEVFDDTTLPTPTEPDDAWDYWAINYGYPYRGQPSVVFRLPFELDSGGGVFTTDTPHGYGDVHGLDGEMHPMDGAITDDPSAAPGSGVDRLRAMPGGAQLEVEVLATNVCGAPEPPPACSTECAAHEDCPADFLCGSSGTCVGWCDTAMPPPRVGALELERHPDIKQAHQFAVMRFEVPPHVRAIRRYDVRVSPMPITDEESFERATPANAASIDSVELVVPTDGEAGDLVEVELGGLLPEVTYHVAVRPVDSCNDAGELAVGQVRTTEIHFTTVSPCYVATAAWGTPMAGEIRHLRRFRDRYLMPHGPGRALVDAYYAAGPHAADLIGDSEALRFAARVSLTPWVWLARVL